MIHMKRKKRSNSYYNIIFSMVTAFVIMLFCTRSSFLYAFNNWDDTNSYFSMGKAIFHGMVPYRDLFDQKGILLYMLYGMASLISYRSFAGVFIIEILAAAGMILALLQLQQLYISRKLSYILTPVAAAAIYASRAFWWGGSAEEMMLPFLAWGLFLSVRFFRESYPQPVPYRMVLTGGLLAGCIMNIKFNSLGFYFAWMAMLFLAELLHGRLLRGICCCIIFLGGMGMVTLPWLIYFTIHHAVKEWLYVYIYLNVFLYSEKLPLLQRLYEMCKTLYFHFDYNTTWFLPTVLGGIWFVIHKTKWMEKLNFLFLSGFLTLGIFIGGVNLPYYVLPLSIFSVYGVILFGICAEKAVIFARSRMAVNTCTCVDNDPAEHAGRKMQWTTYLSGRRQRHILFVAGLLMAVLLSAGIVIRNSQNLSYMKYRTADLWQYQFTDIIRESGIEHPTLLNMGCFDAGLYTAAGIVPTCYFYQTQTIHLPNVETTQYDAMWTGLTDFIVTRDLEPLGVENHYKLAAEKKWQQGAYRFTYRLYQKVK